MSPRQEAAQQIANWIIEHRLTNPFGGDVTKSNDGRYYGVLFAVPRYLDGLVQVYGPKWILIETQGPLGQPRKVFESVANAIAFMKAAFVDHDREAAERVPERKAKS